MKDRAFELLREKIVTGVLLPGVFLSERRLAADLGMSKTPVRAALERLENEGYLRISPQQGAMIRELPIESVIDLFDIRLALEPFVVQRLAGRLTDEQHHWLLANLEAQDRAAAANDRLVYRRLDIDFHVALCEFQGNKEIQQVMRRLQDRLYLVIVRVQERAPSRIVSGIVEHREIAALIHSGDGPAAAAAMTAHLEYGRKMLIER